MYKSQKIDKFFILAILLPIMIAAFRENVGTDYVNYVYMYRINARISFKEWFVMNKSFSGTRFLVWLISNLAGIFKSKELFFGIFSCITVVPVARVLRREYNDSICRLSYFIFLMTLYMTSLNICKQMAAAAIIFYGLKYVRERKFFKYCIIILIASMIHITAVVSIFIYFLYDNKKSIFSMRKILIFFVSIILVISFPNVLYLMGGRFKSYLLFQREISNKRFILSILWNVIFLFFYKSYVRLNSKNICFITMSIIGLLLETTGFYSPYIKRIALYYTFPQFLLIAQFPYIQNFLYYRHIIQLLICFYFGFIFIFTFYILGQANVIPYSFFGGTL